VGIRLATSLTSLIHITSSIQELFLTHTDLIVSENVSEWASALNKMTALKKLCLNGVGDYITEEEKSILRNATHASDITMNKL